MALVSGTLAAAAVGLKKFGLVGGVKKLGGVVKGSRLGGMAVNGAKKAGGWAKNKAVSAKNWVGSKITAKNTAKAGLFTGIFNTTRGIPGRIANGIGSLFEGLPSVIKPALGIGAAALGAIKGLPLLFGAIRGRRREEEEDTGKQENSQEMKEMMELMKMQMMANMANQQQQPAPQPTPQQASPPAPPPQNTSGQLPDFSYTPQFPKK